MSNFRNDQSEIVSDPEMEDLSFRGQKRVAGEYDEYKYSEPCSIVWTCLPLISWIIPFIGHTGITDSDGIIYDFAGPYTIGVAEFAFGKPHKIVKLNVTDKKRWDEAIRDANGIYRGRMHNLFCDNCHSHVAQVLRNYNYGNSTFHNMLTVFWKTIANSYYINFGHIMSTYCGFLVLSCIVFFFYLITH